MIQPVQIGMMQLPEIKPVDTSTAINTYFQTRNQNQLLDMKRRGMEIENEKNLGELEINKMKLEDYRSQAPQREKKAELDRIEQALKMDEGVTKLAAEGIKNLDPDSPTFSQDVAEQVGQTAKYLYNTLHVPKEYVMGLSERMAEQLTPEKVRELKGAKSQIVDGQVVTISGDKATSKPIEGFNKKTEDHISNGQVITKNPDGTYSAKPIPGFKETEEGGGKSFEKALKLRGEYVKDAKDFMTIRDAYGKVNVSAKDPSAAGDMSLLFNYMKILDPNSVVRESEYATAQNAGSVPERVIGLYNRVLNGEKLSDNQRNDFIKTAQKLYETNISQHDRRISEYTRLSKSFGIDPSTVIVDLDLANGSKQPTKNTAESYLRKFSQPIGVVEEPQPLDTPVITKLPRKPGL